MSRRFRVVSLVRLPSQSGIVPLNWLSLRSSDVKLSRALRLGMVLLKRLLLRSSVSSMVSAAQVGAAGSGSSYCREGSSSVTRPLPSSRDAEPIVSRGSDS